MSDSRARRIFAAFVLSFAALVVPAAAQTVVVTNTGNAGPGSLRDAIEAVNDGAADAIDASGLAGAISLLTPLPAIVNPVTITGNAGLTIDGSALSAVLLSAGANVTFTDVVIGDGLSKVGTGTLQWDGLAQAFTGATTIWSGTLATSTDNLLSDASAVNVAAGATLDMSDTLQAIGSLSGAGTVTLSDFGTLGMGSDNASTTFAGTIDGATSGQVVKLGTGTFTLGTGASVTGLLNVSEGVVALDGANALAGVENLEVANGATVTLGSDQVVGDLNVGSFFDPGGLVDLGSNTLTVNGGSWGSFINGTIAGVGGSLHVTGNVQMVFGLIAPGVGTGTYTGTTRVSGDGYIGLFGDQVLSAETGLILEDNGMIEIDGVNTFASLSGTGGELFLCDCADVTFDQNIDTTFSGSLSGDLATTFTKAGTGRLALTADTSLFDGSMIVTGGTLAGTTDSLWFDIANDATVEFDQDFDGTYSAAMSGSGGLLKSGTGAVTVDANNGYTGGTTLNAGMLIAGTDGAFGSGGLTVNGGTLQLDFFQGATSLSGSGGTVALLTDGWLSLDQDIDTMFAGTFSGDGMLIKDGTGALTLTGASTGFTGGLAVSGGTVVLGAGSSVANAEGILINFDSVLRLQSDQTLTDVINIGTLDIGAHTAVFNTMSAGLLSLGNITGDGAVVIAGAFGLLAAGEFDFTGSVTFTGATESFLAADNALANTSSITINDNAYVDLSGLQRFGSLSGNGGELFLCDCTELTVNQTTNGVFAGSLTGDPGSIFIKDGAARLMLAGDTSLFFGTIYVSGGTLAGTTSTLWGGIINDASLEFSQNSNGTFDGVIVGDGRVIKSGSGTVTFEGAHGYTGGTFIGGGTLLVASDESLGDASGDVTFGGGTLGVLDDFISTRDFVFEGAGTIDTGDHDALLMGALTGAGSLTKTGAGWLFLTGTSSYSGGTRVLDGALFGDTDSLQGNIFNQALVAFDQSGAGVYGGAISGIGDVMKFGAGVLTMTGAHSYTGFTGVFEGGLILDGSLVGDVIVLEGASLSGSGSIAGSVFVAGTFTAGALPGGSGGSAGGGGESGAAAVSAPMSIAGNFELAPIATYQTQLDTGGSIAPMQVGGTAFLNGATLHLVETAGGIGSTTRRMSSTVLSAGAIDGTFGAVTGLDETFDSFLFAGGTELNLLLVRNNVDFAGYAGSLNGSAVGAALAEARAAGGSADLSFVTRELAALATDAELSTALDRISGAAHASVAGVSMIASADVIDLLTTRLAGRGGWWLQGLGSNLSLEADVDPGASTTRMRGAMAGYDRQWSGAMAGVAAGFTDNDIDASAGLDNIDGRAYRGAAYAQMQTGPVVIDGVLSAASHQVRGSRGISFAAMLEPEFGGGLLFGGVSRTASFDYDVFEIAGVVDAGYRLQAGGFTVQPAIGMQLTRMSRDSFAETGADALDLSAASSVVSSTAARARLSIERRIDRAGGRWLAPRAGVRYTRTLGDRDVPFVASLAGVSFTASSFALPESLLAARAGIAAGFGAFTLSLDYRAAFASGHRHHLVSAGFGF